MLKTNFWNDAARYGAIMGVVSAIFSSFSLMLPTAKWISVIEMVVFILLLYFFTKRRAKLYGGSEVGFSYGQGLKYIFWMMVFGGILLGAWEIVARNVLFTEKYEEALNQSLAMFEGIYPNDMFDQMTTMAHKVMFSPIWVVVSTVLGMIIKGVFFGLFISAFTRREPNVFSEEPKNDAE